MRPSASARSIGLRFAPQREGAWHLSHLGIAAPPQDAHGREHVRIWPIRRLLGVGRSAHFATYDPIAPSSKPLLYICWQWSHELLAASILVATHTTSAVGIVYGHEREAGIQPWVSQCPARAMVRLASRRQCRLGRPKSGRGKAIT